jgi:hypothetical protein
MGFTLRIPNRSPSPACGAFLTSRSLLSSPLRSQSTPPSQPIQAMSSATESSSYASSSSSSSSSAPVSEISKLFLHNMIGKIKVVPRIIRAKNGKQGETHLIPVHVDNPTTNLRFILGDADANQLCRVIRPPGTFEGGQGSFTMALLLPKPHDDGARHMWGALVDGMKEVGVLDKGISTHPDVMKLVSFPPYYEGNEGGVIMSVTLGDDVEYLYKIPKGKRNEGKFAKITRDHIRKGDMVVVSVRLDRHRDKPKHRFTRYVQCVYVIERGNKTGGGVEHVIGSGGASVDVVTDYDPDVEEEEAAAAQDGGCSGGDAAGAAGVGEGGVRGGAAVGAATADAGNAGDESDEFAQALKRARNAV